jgi:hypothetical protein
MIRSSRACDLQLTLTFTSLPLSPVAVSFNGTHVLSYGDAGWGSPLVVFRVPRELIRDGINILAIEDDRPEPRDFELDLHSVDIEPRCAP